MGIRHSKASVDISTTPKAPEHAVKEAIVTEDGDAAKVNNTAVEVEDADLRTEDEAGHLKPELDVKESRVASLKRNLSFSKLKKMFAKGEGGGTEVETKEGADDVKGEAASDEVGDAKDEAKEEEEDKEVAVPEEKSAAEGEWKVTALKNSLFKMFSRETADNEVGAAASKKEEGIVDGEVEGAGDGLKTEESLEEKAEVVSKVTNLKKRLSFKAIKNRFSKEKKEDEAGTLEKENEACDAKEEVKNCDDVHTEVVKVPSDGGAEEMAPPTEAPPAVPVEPVPDEEVNVKNVLEPKEGGILGEIETPNAGTDDLAVEGAAETLAAKTS